MGKGGEARVGCPTLGTESKTNKSLTTTTGGRRRSCNASGFLYHGRLLASRKELRKGPNLPAQVTYRLGELCYMGFKRGRLATYSIDYGYENHGN